MSAMIVNAFVTETDEMFTRLDRVQDTAVLDGEIAMAEPAGEMPFVFWP